jgi:hypothetical protein
LCPFPIYFEVKTRFVLHSYLLRLLSDVPDADVGVRWGALASLLSFAVIRALSSSDYVAVRY